MIIITGASDGLGKQLAKLYQEAGIKVVNISRNDSPFADINITLSLREGSEIEEAAQQVAEMDEPIEAFIYCAGVESLEELGNISEEEIKRLMSTNVKPQILLTSLLIDRIEKDGSDIVCVSSTSGTKGVPGRIAYSTSKWAVRGLAQNLQAYFRDKPNRVISFVPGGFKSDIVKKVNGQDLANPDEWMDPEHIALFMKHILDLPKNMEVSEVIVNRKVTK